ncbi:MAG TPA: carbohydrate ABC transporter permease, partial [Ilumatobacteraceae bacterium]
MSTVILPVAVPVATATDTDAVAVRTRRRRPMRVVWNLVAVGVFAVFAFPVYWMVLTSFRRGVDIQQPTPEFVPSPGTLQNYRKVFDREFFWTAIKNSLTVTLSVLVLALFIAFLAAVAVSRFRFRGRKAFIVTVLLVQMVPAEALIISLFRILDGWDLINTLVGLTLTYLAFVLPFTIWTLRGFVAAVPKELEEASMVEGSTRFRAFMTITLPLVAPGLVATGVFAFIQAWNEFIFALVIMNKPESQTLPVWLQAFNEGAKGTDWGGVMAGSTLMAIPVVVFFLLVQRRLA